MDLRCVNKLAIVKCFGDRHFELTTCEFPSGLDGVKNPTGVIQTPSEVIHTQKCFVIVLLIFLEHEYFSLNLGTRLFFLHITLFFLNPIFFEKVFFS